jgi:hypothetical protein
VVLTVLELWEPSGSRSLRGSLPTRSVSVGETDTRGALYFTNTVRMGQQSMVQSEIGPKADGAVGE